MNQTKTIHPLLPTLAAGLLGAGLRLMLYRTGFDSRGILSDTHPLHMACMLLAAVLGLWLALRCRKEEANFSADRTLCRIFALAACALLAANAFTYPQPLSGALHTARLVLACGCAFCIMASAWISLPEAASLMCHGVICIYFAVDMLCRYQTWSGNPQLPDYCFHVLSCVFLALSSYQRMAFDVGLGKVRTLRFTGLMALLLCLMSTVGPDPWQFFLGGACWALTNLLLPLPAAEQPAQPEES